MKALKQSGNLTIVAMLVVAALAGAFWILLLSPKREEAAKLGEQVAQVESSLAQHEAEVAEAEEARERFPEDYQKLVVLGKAVPGGDETASLLVQVNGIARRAGVQFRDLSLGTGGGSEEGSAPAASPGASASTTEAEASLLPLGASTGPAGLAVMPYTLTFDGSFFQIADFIEGLDSTVETRGGRVTVDGRLVTIDNFTLSSESDSGSSRLTASFSVTTYLTPPGEGLPGDAPSASPSSTATPAAATLGGAR